MNISFNRPIPSNKFVENWKTVAISDNGEPMVLLNTYSPMYIEVQPQYYLQQIPHAIAECYCRKTVADLLLKAALNLPPGYKFVVWDAWRPVAVQKELFESYKAILATQTNLQEADLDTLAQTYVSLPSTDEKKPSPHLTGGAIDLSIIDDNGNELDMGTGFDHFGIEAQSDHYEIKIHISQNEEVIRKNRRFLYNLLVNVGFTNYPHEWWHFDYGNQFWGIQTGKDAIYNKFIFQK